MGKAHLKAALNVPGVEVTAVAEPRVERLEDLKANMADAPKAIRDQLNAIVRYDDFKTMIKDGAVDAVSLALPTDLHFAATSLVPEGGRACAV